MSLDARVYARRMQALERIIGQPLKAYLSERGVTMSSPPTAANAEAIARACDVAPSFLLEAFSEVSAVA